MIIKGDCKLYNGGLKKTKCQELGLKQLKLYKVMFYLNVHFT